MLFDRSLIYVTGKGGVGRSTVAGAPLASTVTVASAMGPTVAAVRLRHAF